VNAGEDFRLIGIAREIADGRDVDWDGVRQQLGDEASNRVVSDLQAVEQIAAFHRSTDGSNTLTASGTSTQREALGAWGHLTLVRKIAQGAFGTVYLAHDPKLETDVALKLVTLPADGSVDGKRALREARHLARVHHAHVVRVYGADIVDGQVGMWMEVVNGQTLAALLQTQGRFGASEAALIGSTLCQALAAVHSAGLIHGDVKAQNVMREAGGRTVLMDFGTGKDLQSAAHTAGVSDVAGTPLYLAPEVFQGAERSKASDIYSLGVLLYHLVTNGYPVQGRTMAEVEAAHDRGARTRLRDARPDLPAALVDIVERAIAVDPRERFQSAGAFEAALASFLGRTPPVPPSPVFKRWLFAAAAVAVILSLGAARYWTVRQASRDTAAAAPPPPTTTRRMPDPAASYRIGTTLYRRSRGGVESPLRSGDRVAKGDDVFAKLSLSAPTYVYIVNEDDQGKSYVLFPLPGRAVDNPIPAGTTTRIPGTREADISWNIDSVGGREHFLIFASPERLQVFEELFASLPRPSFSLPSPSPMLPDTTIGKLRGVGGLTASTGKPSAGLAAVFTQPLGDSEETTSGLWVRQLTVDNPARK